MNKSLRQTVACINARLGFPLGLDATWSLEKSVIKQRLLRGNRCVCASRVIALTTSLSWDRRGNFVDLKLIRLLPARVFGARRKRRIKERTSQRSYAPIKSATIKPPYHLRRAFSEALLQLPNIMNRWVLSQTHHRSAEPIEIEKKLYLPIKDR